MIALSALRSWGSPFPTGLVQDTPPPPRNPVVVERGPHHRVWQTFSISTNVFWGATVRTNYSAVTNSYVELGTGLHYWENNQWQESKAEIELFQGGAAARKGQHKVAFKPNLNAQGAIELMTPDGKLFRSQVIGLSYFDAATGSSSLIASVKNSIGQLIPPNQVIYPDAFEGVKADVRYTYTVRGFEQDIILRESLPSPAEFGHHLATTRLEVWTEFLDAPQPMKKQRFLKRETDPLKRQQMAVPDVVDEYLDFGQMKMGRGAAFELGTNPQSPVSDNRLAVGKQWERIDNRDFLVEALEFAPLESELAKLPKRTAKRVSQPQANSIALAGLGNSSTPAVLPLLSATPAQSREAMLAAATRRPRNQARDSALNGAIQIAKNEGLNGKGFVVDYILYGAYSNFTFQGDTTYYLTNLVDLVGTTRIEGGTVVKFTNYYGYWSPSINIDGPLICQTSPYRPAIFTAKDDNTVGDNIPGSSGNPTNWYGNNYLLFAGQSVPAVDLHDLNMRYAITGVEFSGNTGSKMRNLTFLDCWIGFFLLNTSDMQAQNLLIHNAEMAMFTSSSTCSVQHATLDTSGTLIFVKEGDGDAYTFTNCVLANVTNLYVLGDEISPVPTLNGSHNAFFNTITNFGSNPFTVGSNPFQSVGAGYYYLGTNSTLRDAGTSAIDSALLADLRMRTTYPPQVLEGLVSEGDVTLSPITPRDTDTPDLGYHYPAVDYAINTYAVTNGTLSVLNGTVLATFGTTGIWLQDGADFVSAGTPLNPNRFTLYSFVQEQPIAWGDTGNATLINAYKYGATPSSAAIRFTEFFNRLGDYSMLTTSNGTHNISPLVVQDSAFCGGLLSLATNGTGNPSYLFRNTLFDRVATYFWHDAAIGLTNALFRGGILFLDSVTSNNCTIRDCAFDATSITNAGGVLHSHNGYLNQTNTLSPANTNDVVVTNFTFQCGPLGHFYQPTNSPLLHAGSQPATNAGLYHYTVTTNQIKEGTNQVSIGLHYLAVDGSGNPVDTDGDGLPDYVEDRNGNGVVDTGETSYADSDSDDNGIPDSLEDSDYDGVSNAQELAEGTDPYASNSVLPHRLGYWTFDTTQWLGERGQVPRVATNLVNVASWQTNALRIATNVSVQLSYSEIETNGTANINLRSGTVRFWFRPEWAGTNQGGSGPATSAGLIEVGRRVTGSTNEWWSLHLNTNGTQLVFEAKAGGVQTNYLTVPVSWASNEWHEIALIYTATNSILYLDGQAATNGPGVTYFPSAAVRAADGFSIGSDYEGGRLAKGRFEELETFNHPLGATEVWDNYFAIASQDSDGDSLADLGEDELGTAINDPDTDDDGMWDGWEVYYGLNPFVNDASGDLDGDGVTNLDEFTAGTDPTDPTSGPQRQLGHWTFDTTEWLGERGQVPRIATNIQNVASWRTNALQVQTVAVSPLLNVDFADGAVPSMMGFAATGLTAGDYWNHYYLPNQSYVSLTNLQWSDQSTSTVGVAVQNAPGHWGFSTGNLMYNTYAYAFNYGSITVTVTNLSDGVYDLYLYGHGDQSTQNSKFVLSVGGSNIGTNSTGTGPGWNTTNWVEGLQYVVFRNVTVAAGTNVVISVQSAGNYYVPMNGFQIVPHGTGSQLSYKAVESDNSANIALRVGSVRFWFKPDWASTNLGGTGPGSEAGLIEVGRRVPASTNQWWSLRLDTNGTGLTFEAQANGVQTNYLTMPVSWASNQWHEIVLTYTPTNSILYLDGQSVTNGPGVTYYPSDAVKAMDGFSIGSDYQGRKSAVGRFEELETYNYALNALDVLTNYQTVANRDTDGDGLTDVQENQLGTSLISVDSDYDGRSDSQELQDGTDPLNPASVLAVRLGCWRFNDSNWIGEQGQVPMESWNITNTPTWNGTGLLMNSPDSANLKYHDVETNGNANINLRNGTVRFWFKPSWSSTNAGGAGPQTWGRLIELGAWSPEATNGWWSLYLNPEGTSIKFESQADGQGGGWLNVPVSLNSDVWYQITLTYTPTNTALYINGQLAQVGGGVTLYPDASVRASRGFSVASETFGWQPVMGALDELETFNYPLSAEEINHPLILSASETATNGFQVKLYGDSLGRTWELQASSDLLNWSNVGSVAMTNGTTVWVDDSVPAGAQLGETWNWVSSDPSPHSGALAHKSTATSGTHQHYFENASGTLAVNTGDVLYAYVYLNPTNVPAEVMLQWKSDNWEHRAYWGSNQIGWGTDGTTSRRYMGALPATGQWIRLEVPAGYVGLEGHTLTGMAFSLYDGQATWDETGKVSSPTSTSLIFTDETASAYTNRFYRAMSDCQRSVNVVGFQTISAVSSNWYMVANQLVTGDNSISNLFAGAPLGTKVFWHNGQGYDTYEYIQNPFTQQIYWSPNGNLTIGPGEGVWLNCPQTTSFKFVGELWEGALSNLIPANQCIRSFMAPRGGRLDTTLGLPDVFLLQVSYWNAETQGYQFFYNFTPNGWYPYPPSVKVGESFFLTSPVATNWTATFFPPVTIASPADGTAMILPTNVNLTVSLAHPCTVTQVVYYANTNLLGVDVASPFSLTWTNPPSGNHALTARATDSSGLVSTSSVVYVNFNTLPSISTISDQATGENTAAGSIAFTVSDTETSATNLTLSAASSNPSLLPVSNIAFGGSGANRSLNASPVTNIFGLTTVTVFVVDADGGTNTCSFLLRVYPTSAPNGDLDYDGVKNWDEVDEGTDPYDETSFVPRLLGRWRFNDPTLTGEQGQLPVTTNQLFIEPTFSGTGVRGTNWSLLKYREVETNGQANINLRNGTVRLWFKPNWSSTTSGGTGPQSWGRLIELGNSTGDYSYGMWHVAMNPEGTNLFLETQSDGSAPTYWIVPIDWHAGEWHQVAVTYTPTNTAAYIDGTEAQYSYHYNSGVSVYPNATVRAAEGLKIGSNQYGTDNATGVFDEVETYNYPLSATEMLDDYNAVIYGDDDGDGVPNYQDAQSLNPSITNFVITILQPANGQVINMHNP